MRIFSRVLTNGFYIREGLRVDEVKSAQEFTYYYGSANIYGLYVVCDNGKDFVLVTNDAVNILSTLLLYGYIDATGCTRIEAANGQYDVVGLQQYQGSNSGQFI